MAENFSWSVAGGGAADAADGGAIKVNTGDVAVVLFLHPSRCSRPISCNDDASASETPQQKYSIKMFEDEVWNKDEDKRNEIKDV